MSALTNHRHEKTVLIRPDEDCIDLIWSCRVPARRGYGAEDLARVAVELEWA